MHTHLCKGKSEVKCQMKYCILFAVLIGLFDLTCADAVISIIYQDSSWKHNLNNTKS